MNVFNMNCRKWCFIYLLFLCFKLTTSLSEENIILSLESQVTDLESRYSILESIVDKMEEGADLDSIADLYKLVSQDTTTTTKQSEAKVDSSEFGIESVCSTESGLDYKTKDVLASFPLVANDLKSCCSRCKATRDCNYFTIDSIQGICYLKKSKGEIVRDSSSHWLISGDMII